MRKQRFAIVFSHYHKEVMDGLLAGARGYFEQAGFPVANDDMIEAPGAFEIPLIAQTIARSGRYDGVVCLGCVIKGDTAHFEYISQAAALGIMQAGLATQIPISFGILTTYTEEQALTRAQRNDQNKGIESAKACHLAAKTLQAL